MSICFENYQKLLSYGCFSGLIKFLSSERNTENTIPELHFRLESDNSEENASHNEVFRSTILQPFYLEPEQERRCSNESHEKGTTEAVLCRQSSKQVFLKIYQISQENICIGVLLK